MTFCLSKRGIKKAKELSAKYSEANKIGVWLTRSDFDYGKTYREDDVNYVYSVLYDIGRELNGSDNDEHKILLPNIWDAMAILDGKIHLISREAIIRNVCPQINYPTEYRNKDEEGQLKCRIQDFQQWKSDYKFEPPPSICNRVISILWRAYDWDYPELKKEVTAVAYCLLSLLPKNARDKSFLSDRLYYYINKDTSSDFA